MAIPVGSKAPDFTLKSKQPSGVVDVKLSNNFGKKNTLLLFFPLAFTGVCTQEMCDITAGLNAYTGVNAEVIGISVDSPFAQASCANGLSTLMPITSALTPVYALRPAVMSHISCVQTPVKASGKKSRSVFFLPKLLLSFTSTTPEGCLDLRVKSGAFEPTGIAIRSFY